MTIIFVIRLVYTYVLNIVKFKDFSANCTLQNFIVIFYVVVNVICFIKY